MKIKNKKKRKESYYFWARKSFKNSSFCRDALNIFENIDKSVLSPLLPLRSTF
jgi:hypothetical protein